ncbi:response regulator transcription factor [Parasutterella excrementihominis]|uniref:response regulator transcription factor n=2 Tax=Parasutterella excrementihominis TaxID=487175 RepID=UPI00242DB77C|nr:response regulator [Parasutterella excrementihominis]
MPKSEIKVLVRIVDDDSDLRAAIRFLLESEGWEVADYYSAADFLLNDDPEIPGCLILDVRMPEMTGIELQGELKQHLRQIPIVFLSAHGDIEMAVKTLHEGAVDFLTKPVQEDKLVPVISRAVKLDLIKRGLSFDHEEIKERYKELTERETQIVSLLIKGLLNREIGERLGISTRTVEVHRARAFKKLQVHTISELIQSAHAAED